MVEVGRTYIIKNSTTRVKITNKIELDENFISLSGILLDDYPTPWGHSYLKDTTIGIEPSYLVINGENADFELYLHSMDEVM